MCKKWGQQSLLAVVETAEHFTTEQTDDGSCVCDDPYISACAYFTHNGKRAHRNAEITALGLWVVSIKFVNGPTSHCWPLPGCGG